MDELKIDLWRVKETLKAYGCMILLNFMYVGILVVCPLMLILAGTTDMTTGKAAGICAIAWFACASVYTLIRYFTTCKKCIDKKVTSACEECKCRKLNLCNSKIDMCKKANAEEAFAQMCRIEKEKAKLTSLKKDKNFRSLMEHLDEEYQRWSEIYNKNKN